MIIFMNKSASFFIRIFSTRRFNLFRVGIPFTARILKDVGCRFQVRMIQITFSGIGFITGLFMFAAFAHANPYRVLVMISYEKDFAWSVETKKGSNYSA